MKALVGLLTLLAMIGTGWLPGASASEVQFVSPEESLQERIDQAPTGSVLELEPGLHRGNIMIDKPITLGGTAETTIRGEGSGNVITINANHVTVRNLEVTHSGMNQSRDDAGIKITGDSVTVTQVSLRDNLHGIYVEGGNNISLTKNEVVGLAAEIQETDLIHHHENTRTEPEATEEPERGVDHGHNNGDDDHAHEHDDLHHAPPGTRSLKGNGIHFWSSTENYVAENHVHHVRDGIYVSFTSATDFLNNRVHDSRYGIHYMSSHHNTIVGNDLSRNVAGAALMLSHSLEVRGNHFYNHHGWRAFGLLLQDVDRSEFRDNLFRANRMGVSLQNSQSNRFAGNRFAGNFSGLHMATNSPGNQFTANRIGPNVRNIELSGTPPRTDWSVDGRGNRWFGASAPDLDGDGVAEFPHHDVDLLADRREDFELIQLISDSPGVRLLEWALSRAPIPGTRYITDPHPLTRGPNHD